MSRPRIGEVASLTGAPVHTTDGREVGTVDTVYYDLPTEHVTWIDVRSNDAEHALAPAEGVRVNKEPTPRVQLPYEADMLWNAPSVTTGVLSEDQERRLYLYYGLEAPDSPRSIPYELPKGSRSRRERSAAGSVGGAANEGHQRQTEETLGEDLRHGREEAQSLGHDVAELASDVSGLIRNEMKQARMEMSQQVRRSAMAGTLGLGAALFGVLALVFLALAAMFTLALVLAAWAAALATTGLLLLLAAIAGLLAYLYARRVQLAPQQTMQSVKEDVEWARSKVTSSTR